MIVMLIDFFSGWGLEQTDLNFLSGYALIYTVVLRLNIFDVV